MTIVHRWSVTLFAEGDRAMTRDEADRFAAALARIGAGTSGHGAPGHGADLAIAAGTRDEAIAIARSLLADAAKAAGLPPWTVSRAEAIGDHEPPAAPADTWGDEYDEYGTADE